MSQRYDTYKESGVQWLGEIPGHWGCIPFRRLASVKSNLVHPVDYMDYPQIAPDSIEKNSGRILHWKTVADSNVESDNHLFFKGQILYSKIRPLLNKVTIAPFDGLCSADMYPIETMQNTKFLLYYMLSNAFLESVTNATRDRVKMPKINREELGSIDICVPPLSEQRAIVTYLDDKCGKIDNLVEGKQKQINLLAEMKQRIIADAVTRGLNPNVKMKATNIPWLPEIPEHWEMKRLKYLVSCNDESLTNAEDPNLEINYVEIGDVTDIKGIAHTTKYRFEDAPSRARRKTRKNDVIVSTVRTYLKAIAKIPENGIIVSTGFAVLRAIDVNSSYLAFCCMSNSFINSVVALSKGISYPAITASELLNLYIPLPPFTEQRAIVTYLDDKCSKIDLLVEKLKAEIEAIKEYKQRLISDVVTGQIKVC